LTSLLFFASIVVHEPTHSILAIRSNIPVKEITLFVFGVVSQITKEVTSPRAELSIAMGGPLASLSKALHNAFTHVARPYHHDLFYLNRFSIVNFIHSDSVPLHMLLVTASRMFQGYFT
jgi:Zn-dependent protease